MTVQELWKATTADIYLTRSRIIITNKEAEIHWKHRDNTAT